MSVITSPRGERLAGPVIFGGYGTFGARVARELVRAKIAVTIAGRNLSQAESFARQLGRENDALRVDVTDRRSCRAALAGRSIAVNCAGPFHALGTTLLDACLETGSHYVDIADDRSYAKRVRSYHDRFRSSGLAAVYGCSSLPALSGALALIGREKVAAPLERVRVTLFIGNDNAKGAAAIGSLVSQLGRPIATPQGLVRGFRDRELVMLPEPFGCRAVYNFDSPDYDLLPPLVGAPRVSVKMGFEWAAVNACFALMARFGARYGRRTAAMLDHIAELAPRVGSSGGAVMTELIGADNSAVRAALVAARDGQRMASLPCALVVQSLLTERTRVIGATTAYELLGARGLLDPIVRSGFALWCDTVPRAC